MTTAYQLKQTYSFDVYAVSVLGNNFKNVTVLAILDYDSAVQIADVTGTHVQIFPMLPAGSAPNNPSQYNYLKIKTASGEITVLGIPWIKDDTVQLISSTTVSVKVANITPSDIPRLRNALIQNGFPNLEIEIV